MTLVGIALSLLNLAFVLWRGRVAMKERRLFGAVWFILGYFSVFICWDALGAEFEHLVGFTGTMVVVDAERIAMTILFALLFNIAVAFGEELAKCLVPFRPELRTHVPPVLMDTLIAAYLGLLLIGASGYASVMAGADYRQYVEAENANWAQVLFFASSPGVVFAVMRRRWLAATAFALPFLYFAIVLYVRSFLLLSACPVMAWFLINNDVARFRSASRGRFVACAVGMTVLLSISLLISSMKTGSIELPERQLDRLMMVAFDRIDATDVTTEGRSLEHYTYGLAKPVYRALGLARPDDIDTPVVVAQLVTGHSRYWEQYYHYPLLWYTDAYISFRWYGVTLGLLWGLLLVGSEHLIRRHQVILGIFLPSFCWHTYMILRGAPGVASGGISTQFSVQVIIGVLAWLLLKTVGVRGVRRARQTYPAAA